MYPQPYRQNRPVPQIDPSQLVEADSSSQPIRGCPVLVTGMVEGYKVSEQFGSVSCVLQVAEAFGGGVEIYCDGVFAKKGEWVTVEVDAYIPMSPNGRPQRPGAPKMRYLSHKQAQPDGGILAELAVAEASANSVESKVK